MNRDKRVRNMIDHIVSDDDNSKYLGPAVQKNGSFEENTNNRINCGWIRWRGASGFLCDERTAIRLKGIFYKTVSKTNNMSCSKVNDGVRIRSVGVGQNNEADNTCCRDETVKVDEQLEKTE